MAMPVAMLKTTTHETPKLGAAYENVAAAGGRGSDLVEKQRLIDFLGLCRALARHKAFWVGFYHTNFSRRSLPRHPEP